MIHNTALFINHHPVAAVLIAVCVLLPTVVFTVGILVLKIIEAVSGPSYTE